MFTLHGNRTMKKGIITYEKKNQFLITFCIYCYTSVVLLNILFLNKISMKNYFFSLAPCRRTLRQDECCLIV